MKSSCSVSITAEISLDGRKRVILSERTTYCDYVPAELFMGSTTYAEAWPASHRGIPLNELLFTGYEEVASEEDKKSMLKTTREYLDCQLIGKSISVIKYLQQACVDYSTLMSQNPKRGVLLYWILYLS